jgi:hypothetical protein
MGVSIRRKDGRGVAALKCSNGTGDQVARGASMAYIGSMIFIETPVFTKRLRELLDDDSYADDLAPEECKVLKRIIEQWR